MSSIGGLLKEARTKKSLSHEEIYAKIKIHPHVLHALEENQFDKLPSPLFVKSFLRSYAEFLGVNADEVVGLYEKEGKKDPEQIFFIKAVGERPRLQISWGSLLFPAFLVACAAVGYTGLKNLDVFRPHPKTPAAKARHQDVGGSVRDFWRTSAGVPSAKQAPAKKTPAGLWLRSVEDGTFPEISRQTPIELKVTAIDNVWMRVTVDGKVLFQSILKRGTFGTWKAKDSLEIWTGNSSGMALAVNHTMLGSPGRGVVKRLVIDREGVRIAS